MLSALATKKRPSLNDVKLKFECRVIIKRLPAKYLHSSGGNSPSKSPTKKLLKGKKRLLIYDSNSDSGEERNIVNHHAKNFLTGVRSLKGKSLKKVSHPDERTPHLEDSSKHSISTSYAPSVCKVAKSKFVVEKIFNTKESRAANKRLITMAFPSGTQNENSKDDRVSTSDNRNGHHLESDDDLIDLSSGDEETFSSQSRFKNKPLNRPIPSLPDDEDGPFPNLAPSFQDEIEEVTSLFKRVSGKDVELDLLVNSGRFNQKGKKTIQIDPLHMTHPITGRFSYATAGDSSRRETDYESDEEDQPNTSKSKGPRTIKMCEPHGFKKKSANGGESSLREILSKQPGMESQVSISKATKKTATTSSTDPSIKFITPKLSAPVPIEKKSCPATVKAKMTKTNRVDLFVQTLVGEANESMEGDQTATNSSSPIRSDVEGNDKEADESGNKRHHDEEDEQAATDSLGETPSFKKRRVRVGRKTSVSQDGDKNYASPGPSKDHHNRYQSKPRADAQPLGRKHNWTPSKYNKTSDRAGRREVPHPRQQPENNTNGSSSNHAEETFPIPDREIEHCDPIPINRSTSNDINGGILRKSNSGSKKRVSIVEERNTILEIELISRIPPKASTLPKTPNNPVDKDALTNDILYRICNWGCEWIELHKKSPNEPPPLLQEFKRENGNLPELPLFTVVSAYDSLESYCSIFTPLILHETWASFCKTIEPLTYDPIETLISSKPTFSDGFALLQCAARSKTTLFDMDLVTLTVQLSPERPARKYFGVLKEVVTRKSEKRDRPEEIYCNVTFVLWIKKSNVPKELDKHFAVTKIGRLKTVVNQLVFNAELASSPLCEVILHPSDYVDAFTLYTDYFKDINYTLLNPSQYEAVESITRAMVSSPDSDPKVSLLQGPPGTGKSHVIVQLISRIMLLHFKNDDKYPCILVCAPSDSAIDEIADRLILIRRNRYNIVRVGKTAHPNVRPFSLDELEKKENIDGKDSPESGRLRSFKEELNNLRKTKKMLIASIDAANKKGQTDEARLHGRKLEQLESQIEGVERSYQECYKKHSVYFNTEKEKFAIKKDVILRANVICATLNSCRNKAMESLFIGDRARKLNYCIIDEASQCTEPESLTPLALGIKKLVLIGDPDQLPATVTSQIAAKNRFDQSLFNRFYSIRSNMEDNEGVMMLNTQYRMAPAICEWPSKYFYGGKLVTVENLIRNGPCYDYRVLNVMDGLEQLSEQSFNNENEAALVAKIATLIVNSPSTLGKSVGVITFYRSQKQCIIKQMSKEDALKVEVDTVDSFQGREKDIVIVSCVRARKEKKIKGDIGFVSSLQRINVAMTRAKESLIVCGNFKTLEINETWQNLASNARDRELIHDITSEYSSDNLRHLIMRPMPNP